MSLWSVFLTGKNVVMGIVYCVVVVGRLFVSSSYWCDGVMVIVDTINVLSRF